jgi:hypothetical protein
MAVLGASRDRALVCREPEKTRCVDFLDTGRSAPLSIDPRKAAAGVKAFSLWVPVTPRKPFGRDCNRSTCRSSFFFLPASCCAHCFFNSDNSASARCNSSRSSSTRLSCVAREVRNVLDSTEDATTVGSCGELRIEAAGVVCLGDGDRLPSSWEGEGRMGKFNVGLLVNLGRT